MYAVNTTDCVALQFSLELQLQDRKRRKTKKKTDKSS